MKATLLQRGGEVVCQTLSVQSLRDVPAVHQNHTVTIFEAADSTAYSFQKNF